MQLLLGAVMTGMAVLSGCTLHETHKRCHTSQDCGVGQECYLEYCVIGDAGAATATATRTQAPPARAASTGQNESAAEVSTCGAVSALQAREGACCVAATECYDGPDGTLGVGRCKAGERACVDGKFASCSESVVPHEESCGNQGSDDDCNGMLDDIKHLGETCTRMSGFGPCGEGRLECVDGKDELSCVRTAASDAEACNDQDDDCDGQIDEDFDISNDRENCGACGTVCASAELCCGGRCLAMSAAAANGCPSCSTQQPCAATASCCGGACRDLERDRRHCGACGHSCEQAQRCCDGTCKTDCN